MTVITDDAYLSWNNTEAVTLTYRRGLGTVTETTRSIAVAKKSGLSDRDVTMGEWLGNSVGCVWRIPVALIGAGEEIKPGDKLTDASEVVWIVHDVKPPTWGSNGNSWRLTCQRET